MDEKVERITREVLDAAAEKASGDFVRDVSAPITIAVIAEMLGVPRRDWQLLFRWTNEIIAPQDPEFQRGTAEETLDQARGELFTYFTDLVAARRARPSDDTSPGCRRTPSMESSKAGCGWDRWCAC